MHNIAKPLDAATNSNAQYYQVARLQIRLLSTVAAVWFANLTASPPPHKK